MYEEGIYVLNGEVDSNHSAVADFSNVAFSVSTSVATCASSGSSMELSSQLSSRGCAARCFLCRLVFPCMVSSWCPYGSQCDASFRLQIDVTKTVATTVHGNDAGSCT